MSYQLNPLDGGRPIPFDKSVVVVGRNPSQCDLTLEGSLISQCHARLAWREGTLTVVDLGSHSGTWLNGEQIETAEVRSGDELAFGSSRFRVEYPATRQQPTTDVVEASQKDAISKEPSTIVSLDFLDQLLARESGVKDIDLPMPQPLSTPSETVEEVRPLTEILVESVVDSVSPTVGQEPSGNDDGFMQTLLAEFDAAKAAKIANTGPTETTIDALKILTPYSRSVSGTSTEVQITDDDNDELPAPSKPVASTPTRLNETLPTSGDRPLWKTPTQSEQHAPEPARSRSQRPNSGWQSPSRISPSQISQWAFSPASLAVITIVLLVGMWSWYGTGDGAAIELCHRLRSQMNDRRTQGQTNDPEWESFCKQAVVELKVLAKTLAQTADARQPQRQALLFAIRDDLPLMLTDNAHWKRELTPAARHREQQLDRHLKIAQGLFSGKEIAASTPPSK